MATDKPRFSISMDEATFKKVLEYKEERGIATQSKAIIKIMEMGLEDLEKSIKSKKSSPYSDEAMKLAEDYDGLDGHGKRVVRLVADEEKARCEADRKAKSAALQESREQEEAATDYAAEARAEAEEYYREILEEKRQAAGESASSASNETKPA